MNVSNKPNANKILDNFLRNIAFSSRVQIEVSTKRQAEILARPGFPLLRRTNQFQIGASSIKPTCKHSYNSNTPNNMVLRARLLYA